MNKISTMNILFCFDDIDWNYTRHCAVTILSVLETNKTNKIKFYIMSSYLSKDNIEELKRIVNKYNQEIEFIINNDIISKDLKQSIINRKNLTRWARYRYFFPKFINWIDRILYLDCDILVIKDITEIYNMNMNWKFIVGYYDTVFASYKNKLFWTRNYINSGVLLFDVNKYNMNKINTETIEKINDKYWKYFNGCDQDKINIIFKDDIFIYKKWMNFLIENKYFNKWINDAEIVHCLQKPYIQHSNIPKEFRNLYYKYLNQTKWKWYRK